MFNISRFRVPGSRVPSANEELNKKLESMQAQIDVIKGYLGVSSVK